ncbi:MAG: D-alanyl-D-alanine carboxypeptidase/D-alanyl-D-alanine-endopeptidase [Bacteroidetes bacterium]|nr:MAG: D-alanyl-D-alanine carboxypeptidase/D-alanyl-D-alanine-endopeptidase [Bacteroidota bacterium]
MTEILWKLAQICLICNSLTKLLLINQIAVDESVSEGFAFAAGSPYENKRYVRGIVKKGKTIQKIPLPDPPLACAYTLLETLKKNKIFVRDSATTLRHLKENIKREDYQKNYEKPNRRIIHSHYSPDLKNLILHTNTVSQNFYAESIFKLIGIMDGNYGATVSGGLAVEKFWKDKVNLNGFYMTDGSGLSRLNAVTCQQLTEMLNFFAKQANFSDYYETLAVAGRSGTMSKMCLKTLAENNVRAKSGTMSRVKSYAGYVTDKKGNLLSFAMISNNHTSMPYEIRRQFEKIMVIMANLD